MAMLVYKEKKVYPVYQANPDDKVCFVRFCIITYDGIDISGLPGLPGSRGNAGFPGRPGLKGMQGENGT